MTQCRGTQQRSASLALGALLLAAEECVERNVGYFDNFEANARDVTDCVPLSAETGNQHLVVLLDEVQAAVAWNECCDLLAVLNELYSDTLADGTVGLFSLDANLFEYNAWM